LPTSPGTDIKVTPEMVAPIIPKATRYQGDFRFPVKKVSLSLLREENQDIRNKAVKKPRITNKTSVVLIIYSIEVESKLNILLTFSFSLI
jgi:hypothetical protein